MPTDAFMTPREKLLYWLGRCSMEDLETLKAVLATPTEGVE